MKPGHYQAKVIETDFGQAQSGTPFVRILFEVETDPAEDGALPRIYAQIYLTRKSLGIARARLKAIGFDIDEHDLEELADHPALLAGQVAEVELADETYRGNTSLKVVNIGRPKAKMKKEDLAALTRGMREAKKRDEEEGDDSAGDAAAAAFAASDQVPESMKRKPGDPF